MTSIMFWQMIFKTETIPTESLPQLLLNTMNTPRDGTDATPCLT